MDDGSNGATQVLHRLDMDTSGVMLFSKDSKVTAEMHRMFRARDIHKQYVAICMGVPRTADPGRFCEYIEGGLTQPGQQMVVRASIDRHPTVGPAARLHPSGKHANTIVDMLDCSDEVTWQGEEGEAWFLENGHSMQGACVLQCQPLTGVLLDICTIASLSSLFCAGTWKAGQHGM
ncbi:MAG: hypothetical protein HC767_11705 [Akkermansiaceae bacterium]|nr:hypothetical protein [Akkermansiaceae bacterium]